MILIIYNLGTVNKELHRSINGVKGCIEDVIEDTEVKCLTENIKNCNLVNNTNCNDKQDESDCGLDSPKDVKTTLNQNNNTNTNCDIVCTNGSLTKISKNNENYMSPYFSNIGESDIKSKCKIEVYKLYQTLKSDLEKIIYSLNDSETVKHVAHLEFEASKKKDLENIVMEFERKRINSPDPFSFSAELKTFIQLTFD